MRYPRGEVKNMVIYGYRYNGKMVTTESGYQYRDIEIVEEEAKIVRRIFRRWQRVLPIQMLPEV